MPKVKSATSFPLRLPSSTRNQADEIARSEGISLNQFITLAIAEKIVRLEAEEFISLDRPEASDKSSVQQQETDSRSQGGRVFWRREWDSNPR